MKTADGVEVKAGMVVWPAHEEDDEHGATVVFALRDNLSGEIMEHGDECDITTCLANRKANTEVTCDE